MKNEALQKDLIASVRLQGKWFVKNQTLRGDFIYERDVPTGEIISGYNITRETSVTYGMGQLYKLTHDGEIKESLEKAFAYYQSLVENKGDGKAALVFRNQTLSNASALLLLGLIEYIEADKENEKRYLPLAKQIANYLVSTQTEQGGFVQNYDTTILYTPEEVNGKGYIETDFNNGETFYALIRMYKLTGDEKYLNTSQKAAKYIMSNYKTNDFHKSIYSWAMAGFAYLYQFDPSKDYLEYMNGSTLRYYENYGDKAGDYIKTGRGEPPQFSLATYTEGLVHYGWVLKSVDKRGFSKLKKDIENNLNYLLSLQVDGPRSSRHSVFDLVRGGICRQYSCESQRIDSTKHTLSAMYGYLSLLK